MSNDLADAASEPARRRAAHRADRGPFEGFLQALRRCSPAAGPVAEENLQSRCRGTLLMALSNKLGGLLLTTGNKSEYAVGYATIYGDMCGGFAPIKDLYKTEVYALCRWRNAQGDGEIIPAGVIERAPSAELRDNQTDQDSLPPYEVLDGILERYVDRTLGLRIVAEGFDGATLHGCSSWCATASWKRRQSGAGAKLSRRAFCANAGTR